MLSERPEGVKIENVRIQMAQMTATVGQGILTSE
jgi:hypothetical protein